jgi:hypothetical protein
MARHKSPNCEVASALREIALAKGMGWLLFGDWWTRRARRQIVPRNDWVRLFGVGCSAFHEKAARINING